MPKISIITLAHNYGHFLSDCIESVQSQTFKDFEHIIINAGSIDNTSEIASQYPVRLIEIEDRGLCSSRNYGISLATGEYIANLDADDKIHPTFLEKVVAKASEKTIVCPGMFHGFNGEYGAGWPATNFTIQDIENGNRIFCCALYSKKDFLEVGGYDPDLDWVGLEDWNLWVRLLKNGCKLIVVPECLFYYRVHPNSSTHRLCHTDSVRFPLVQKKNREWQPR